MICVFDFDQRPGEPSEISWPAEIHCHTHTVVTALTQLATQCVCREDWSHHQRTVHAQITSQKPNTSTRKWVSQCTKDINLLASHKHPPSLMTLHSSSLTPHSSLLTPPPSSPLTPHPSSPLTPQIGRASCRERVLISVVGV